MDYKSLRTKLLIFLIISGSALIIAAEYKHYEEKKKIQAVDFEEVGTITCSIGVSEYKEGDTLVSWLARVDRALYEAKENGRNRVEIV